MSKAKLFLIDGSGENVSIKEKMVEAFYEAEETLQRLLVLEPELLPGDQINPENPRRWLLVKREMGVPGGVDEGDRWSLDHLFLDQDGIPTFIECKRASDTRSRREVVAQMLDYAANGIAYWSVDRMRQAASETSTNNLPLDNAILRLMEKVEVNQEDRTVEVENYWKQVETNLRTGKVRLIFVADEIPKELRRLVEFLNEKMTDIEVFAVEVRQFEGGGRKAVVPRVIGFTERAHEEKGGRKTEKQPLTDEEFLALCSPEARPFFKRAFDEANKKKGYSISRGTVMFAIRASVANDARQYASFVYFTPPNRFDVYLAQLPFSEDESQTLRKELLAFGIFQEVGKWSLRATLKGEVLSQVAKAYEYVLNKVDELVKRAAR